MIEVYNNYEIIIKIITLFFFISFFIYLKWNSKHINKDKSYYNLVWYYTCNYMSMVYIFASPFTFLLLHQNITFDMFVWFLSSIYLVSLCIGLLLLGLFTKDKVFTFNSRDARYERDERKRYGTER